MKRFAIAFIAGLGVALTSAPAQASILGWNLEYSGWWGADGGGSIKGSIFADEADAQDGLIALDELTSWNWTWSGNNAVPGFSISSLDGSLGLNLVDLASAGFYVDGRANTPFAGLDQGIFASGSEDKIVDLEALLVENISTKSFSEGAATGGRVTVKAVPEPAVVLGLIAVGLGALGIKRPKPLA